MIRAFCRAYCYLIWVDICINLGGFTSLQRFVRNCQPHGNVRHNFDVPQLCRAVDLACVFYPKTVLCLQHSSALTALLRRNGITADLIVGVQILPPRRHAWVELAGTIINDKPYMRELYQELDRL